MKTLHHCILHMFLYSTNEKNIFLVVFLLIFLSKNIILI